MAHTLYKPHVIGPEGSITTPDLLLDSVSVNWEHKPFRLSIHRLITHRCLQLGTAPHLALPGFALVASGGGTIVAPVTLIYCPQGPMELADAVIGRIAVRGRALEPTAALRIECTVTLPDHQELSIASGIQLPSDSAASTNDRSNPALQRCTAQIQLTSVEPLLLVAGAEVTTVFRWSDEPEGAAVSHTTNFEPLSDDLDDRKPGRYSVGPIGPVKHYI